MVFLQVQEVFKKFGHTYTYPMNREQRNIFYSIMSCKTKQRGTHTYTCKCCKKDIITYNSCHNRHCPNCGDFKKEVWIEERRKDILNVEYLHMVCSIPNEALSLFIQNKRITYDILIKSASEAIQELIYNKYKIRAGIISILHTWNNVADYYPHIHMIVTKGGVRNRCWKEVDNQIDIEKLENVYKRKVIQKLMKEKIKFYNKMEKYQEKKEEYLLSLLDKKWDCYGKEPFKGIEEVIEYLGKYIYKVCMMNERIEKINKKSVVFSYKDSADRSKEKKMRLKGEEFIRRFLLHALPKNFMKIRYYGIYAGRDKEERIRRLRVITKTKKIRQKFKSKIELLKEIVGYDIRYCKTCINKKKKEKPPDRVSISKKERYA